MTLPQLALLAGFEDTSPWEPLVLALRPWCHPVAFDPSLGAPAATLALAPDAPGIDAALAGPGPVAVIVDDRTRIPANVMERADVLITTTTVAFEALGERSVLISPDAVGADGHPPLSAFVRSRWRRRLGLPDPWFVQLGTANAWRGPDDAIHAALAVCSAAAIRGPMLTTALSLAAPTVTDPDSAERLGAVANVHLVIASPAGFDAALDALAADPARATAIGFGGRQLVEERHDLGSAAQEILERVGILPVTTPEAPLADLDAELRALGTPANSPVAIRALRHAAGIAGPERWELLTGRLR